MSDLDSSAGAIINQPRLAQINPPFPCVDAHRFVQLTDKSREQGGHLIRCRRRRCSLECAQAGAAQLNACLAARLLTVTLDVFDESLPDPDGCSLTHNTKSNLTGNASPLCHSEIHSFRGHLTLPNGSFPADHRAAKTRFLDNIRNARKRLGCVLELHANLHLTSLTAGHYDYLAYSDLDEPDLRRVIRDAWFGRDGDDGYRYALVPVAEEYLRAATTYHAKAVVPPTGDDRLLPVAKGEPGYLEATWHTAGFWGDSSLDQTWKSLCDQWFGEPKDPGDYQHGKKYQPDQDSTRDPVSHRLERAFDQPHNAVDPFDTEDRHQSRLKRVARLIASDLPTDPDRAIEPSRFAARWRLHERWIEIPGVLLTPEGHIYRQARETK